jgi:type I restriction enzyme, S subunit
MREDWIEVELGEIVSKLGDGLHGTPKYNESGDYYFINGNNLVGGKIEIKENTKRVTKEEFEKYKKPLNHNTILVSINGTIGNLAFYDNEKVILGKSACYFNLLEIADKRFVSFLLSSFSFLNYANKTATGSTIKNVPLKAMREFVIPLAPLPIQRAIVLKIENLFASLDKGIADLKTAQEQLKVYRQAVLKKAFEGKLTKSELGLNGLQDDRINKEEILQSTNPKNHNSDNGGELPEGWDLLNLGNCGEWKGGGTPSISNKEFWENGNIPWVSSSDMKNKEIHDTERHITEVAISNSSTKWIEKDSLLFVMRSGILRRIFPVSIAKVRLCVNQDIQTLSLKSNILPLVSKENF